MSHVPENELFSAYLDGELSAAERAEVEASLAADPAARQLLDELRALSGTIQSLPQARLGEDLSERVLRQAEREMLTGRPRGDDRPVPPGAAWWSIFRRFTRRRALVWSGIAVAIALFFTLTEPTRLQKPAPRAVARAPAVARDEAPSDRPPSGATIQAAPSAAEPGPREEPAKDDEQPNRDRSGGRPLIVRKGAAGPGLPASAPASPSTSPMGPPTVAKAPALPAPAAPPPAATPSSSVVASPAFKPPAPSMPPVELKAAEALRFAKGQKDAMSGKPTGGLDAASRFDAEPGNKPAVAAAKKSDEKGRAADGMLRVECFVSAAAAQRNELENLLVRNNIQPAPADKLEAAAADADGARSSRGTQLAFGVPVVAGQAAFGGQPARLIYAWARPEQVEIALAELAKRPEDFLSVLVEPAAGNRQQQPLQRFNRPLLEEATTPDQRRQMSDKSQAAGGRVYRRGGPARPAEESPAEHAMRPAAGAEKRLATEKQPATQAPGQSGFAQNAAPTSMNQANQSPDAPRAHDGRHYAMKKKPAASIAQQPNYPVLFVVRVLPSAPPAAASSLKAADRPAAAAPPAAAKSPGK